MADKEKKPKKAKKEKGKKGRLANSDRNPEEGGVLDGERKSSKFGGILFAIISLLSALIIIAVVLFGFTFVLIRMNLMGVADTYKDAIRKTPLLNLALPVERPSDPKEMAFEDLLKAYSALEKENADLKSREEIALAELERLRKFEDEYQARMMVNDEKTLELEKQIADLEAQKKKTDETRYEIERMVAEGNKEGFADYFETVEPAVAREIYAQIVQEKNVGEEAKEFIKLIEGVEPSVAAGIFEAMGTGRVDLIAECLRGMKKDIAAEVLAAMSKEFAAAVTLRMAGPLA